MDKSQYVTVEQQARATAHKARLSSVYLTSCDQEKIKIYFYGSQEA